jgi:uncharacterized protein YbjT (DUF2867 family)
MIVITGATGRTGGTTADALLARGEKIRVVGRDATKLTALAKKGAEVFIGSADDRSSMTQGFLGASAVYLVLPEDLSQQDLRAHQELVSDSYAAAIRDANVRYVVNLSSLGAQHPKGTGPIVGLHYQEQKLNRVPGLNVLHLRAAYFMENLFMSVEPLHALGTLPGALQSDKPMPWIATKDIGQFAASRLAARDFSGSITQELLGERDISMQEAASVVGRAIGKLDLAYFQVPSAAFGESLLKAGLPKRTSELIVEMCDGANAGLMVPEEQRSGRNTTPTTLESFAENVFAPAYLRKT